MISVFKKYKYISLVTATLGIAIVVGTVAYRQNLHERKKRELLHVAMMSPTEENIINFLKINKR